MHVHSSIWLGIQILLWLIFWMTLARLVEFSYADNPAVQGLAVIL